MGPYFVIILPWTFFKTVFLIDSNPLNHCVHEILKGYTKKGLLVEINVIDTKKNIYYNEKKISFKNWKFPSECDNKHSK